MDRVEVVALIQAVNAYYPRRQYPLTVIPEWLRDLDDVTAEAGRTAFQAWRRDNDWPPTAAQLRRLADSKHLPPTHDGPRWYPDGSYVPQDEERYQAWLRRTPDAGKLRPD